MPKPPKIEFEKETFWMVGCKKCDKPNFNIFFNGKNRFIAKCQDCGNIKEIIIKNITTDKPIKCFDARLF